MIKSLNKNTLIKVLSLNSMNVGVNFVLGLASSKIVSAFLGAPGMALLGSMRNFVTMVKSFCTLGISNAVVTLIIDNKDDKRALATIYATFFWLLLIASGILAAVGCFFAPQLSEILLYSDAYVNAIRFFLLLLPPIVLGVFVLAVYNAFSLFRTIITAQLFAAVLAFGVSAVAIWQFGVIGGLYALAMTELLAAIAISLLLFRDWKKLNWNIGAGISWNYLSKIRNFSLMALFSALVGQGAIILVRNIITGQAGLTDAGIWDAANRYSTFLMMFFNSGLSLYYMPKLAGLKTESEFVGELKNYYRTFIPLALVLVVGLFVMRDLIIRIVFTREFLPLSSIVHWQLLGDFIRLLYLAFGFRLLVRQQLWQYLSIEAAFNATYVLLTFYLAQDHKSEAGTMAYVGANLAAMLLMAVYFPTQIKALLRVGQSR